MAENTPVTFTQRVANKVENDLWMVPLERFVQDAERYDETGIRVRVRNRTQHRSTPPYCLSPDAPIPAEDLEILTLLYYNKIPNQTRQRNTLLRYIETIKEEMTPHPQINKIIRTIRKQIR